MGSRYLKPFIGSYGILRIITKRLDTPRSTHSKMLLNLTIIMVSTLLQVRAARGSWPHGHVPQPGEIVKCHTRFNSRLADFNTLGVVRVGIIEGNRLPITRMKKRGKNYNPTTHFEKKNVEPALNQYGQVVRLRDGITNMDAALARFVRHSSIGSLTGWQIHARIPRPFLHADYLAAFDAHETADRLRRDGAPADPVDPVVPVPDPVLPDPVPVVPEEKTTGCCGLNWSAVGHNTLVGLGAIAGGALVWSTFHGVAQGIGSTLVLAAAGFGIYYYNKQPAVTPAPAPALQVQSNKVQLQPVAQAQTPVRQ